MQPFVQFRLLFVLAGAAFVGLLSASFTSIPNLYYPLFASGVFACGLILEAGRQLLTWMVGRRWAAGLAVMCGMTSLALHWILGYYLSLPLHGPEQVRPVLTFFAQLQGASAAAGVFAALRADRDRVSAWLGLALCLVGLFLIGWRGMVDIPTRSSALTATVVAGALLVYGGVAGAVGYWMGQRK